MNKFPRKNVYFILDFIVPEIIAEWKIHFVLPMHSSGQNHQNNSLLQKTIEMCDKTAQNNRKGQSVVVSRARFPPCMEFMNAWWCFSLRFLAFNSQ